MSDERAVLEQLHQDVSDVVVQWGPDKLEDSCCDMFTDEVEAGTDVACIGVVAGSDSERDCHCVVCMDPHG